MFYTASLVLRATEYDPLRNVNFGYLNLCTADIERTVTSYAAYRTQSLETAAQMIIDADFYPKPIRLLVPPVKPRRMSLSPYPVPTLTGPKSDMTNSVQSSGARMPSVPPPPYSAHPDQKMYSPYSSVSAPYNAQPGWSSEVPGHHRPPGYVGSIPGMHPGRLQSATPEGQLGHGYSTRHSAGANIAYSTQRMLIAGLGRGMPPPPPYPGPGGVYESQRQQILAHAPRSASATSVSGVTQEQGQVFQGSPSVSAVQQTRLPVGQTHQDSVVKKSSYPEPKSLSVSPTKRIALEGKPTASASVISELNKDSPFYLVCLHLK